MKPEKQPPTRDLVIQLRINRRVAIFILTAAILTGGAYAVLSEKLTITTSYPPPTGIYKRLTTTAKTILARTSGKVGVGTTAPKTKLDVNGAVRVRGGEQTERFTGTIRWSGSDFEGYLGAGTGWKSFTRGGGGHLHGDVGSGVAAAT